MDKMLVKLLWLRLRGGVRQRLREIKTLRGLLFLSLTLAVIVLFTKQSALSESPLYGLMLGGTEQRLSLVEQFMPLGLLAAFLITVLTAPRPVLSFNPAEINLLFSGPFTRRALLLYKVCFYAFGVLLSSLFIMLLAPAFTYSPAPAFLGIFLSLLFIQLLTVVVSLSGQWWGQYFDVRMRSAYALVALVFVFAVIAWYGSTLYTRPVAAIVAFQESLAGAWLLAPFDVFAHIFLSQSLYPELLQWALLGLSINLGLLVMVVGLDGQCCEISTMRSLESHSRRDRARRKGVALGGQVTQVRSFVRSPVLGGIGPIAWRQMLAALRNAGKGLFVYLSIAILGGPLLVNLSEEAPLWPLLMTVYFIAVFMLPKTLVFDFRSDHDTMENFKALPLPPWKIGVGQLLSVVLLSSLIEWVLLAGTAVFIDDKWQVLLVVTAIFLLPLNWLLYGSENLFFLLFPAPLVPVGRVDFDFLGRTLIGFAVTSAILIGSCLMAAIIGQKLGQVMGGSWLIMAVAAWCSLALIALLTLPLLSWAFRRFDVGISGKSSG